MFQYINIIGYGYVGGSIGFLCKKRNTKFSITDTVTKCNMGEEVYFNNLKNTIVESEKLNQINFYFICVPTPSKRDLHDCDTSIVEKIFDILSENCTKKTIVIIKSTVVPGTCRKIHEKNFNNNIFLFFCPEFLTERNAENDILNEKKIIIGGSNDTKNVYVYSLMVSLYGTKEGIIFCQYEYAEMMKYTINCYLAQKVAFFNDIAETCESIGIEYDCVKGLVMLDKRISPSHTSVPGPDGKYGFGGSCFIKEMKGMIALRQKNHLEVGHLNRILDLNTQRRGKGDDPASIIYSLLSKYMTIPQDFVVINVTEEFDDSTEDNKWTFHFDKNEKLYSIERNEIIYKLTKEKDGIEHEHIYTLVFEGSTKNYIELYLFKTETSHISIYAKSSLDFQVSLE